MVFHTLSFSDTLSQPNFNSKVVSPNLFHGNKVNSHETFSLDVSATSRCLRPGGGGSLIKYLRYVFLFQIR